MRIIKALIIPAAIIAFGAFTTQSAGFDHAKAVASASNLSGSIATLKGSMDTGMGKKKVCKDCHIRK